jgi:serine/threonine-protein kinase
MDPAGAAGRAQANETPSSMPEKFGRYVLIDRVGSGGMADVFRAVTFGWEGFRRVIVVKRIRRELSDSPDFLRMFFDEAKISALLHHPNIVQVYDFGQVDGHYFLAMEYLEGKDVASVMRALRSERRGLPPSLAALIGHEVAVGLRYAHTLASADGQPYDIIHRDVNPANIMLMRTGGVKLLDFGIAKASEAAGKTQTQRAIVKGKYSYLSPEQARCEKIDGRSDLFSWGSTMWEMLTGRRLFGGKTDFERLTAVKQAEVPPPSARRPEIPEALDRIVLRALERDVARRYQSADELAGDLEAFLATAPAEPGAVTDLLTQLFGEESAQGISAAPMQQLIREASDKVAADAGKDDPSGPNTVGMLPSSRSAAGDAEAPAAGAGAAPRRLATAWAVAAALVVAAGAAVAWALHVREAPALTAAAAAATPAAAAAGVVRIDVDSDPAGARVTGSQGTLGSTPLTITLPASTESEHLRFEKAGFLPATYDVRPKSAGIVFVELKPAPPAIP